MKVKYPGKEAGLLVSGHLSDNYYLLRRTEYNNTLECAHLHDWLEHLTYFILLVQLIGRQKSMHDGCFSCMLLGSNK